MSYLSARVDSLRIKRQEKREQERVLIALEVERIAKARDRKRADMRESMPEIARVVDAFKVGFGNDQVRVLFACENGQTVQAKGFRGL